MSRTFQSSALTANDVLEGDVIWWTGDAWTRDLSSAAIYHGETAISEAEQDLSAPRHAINTIGIYRVPVTTEDGHVRPIARREQIRADRVPTFPYLPDQQIADAA